MADELLNPKLPLIAKLLLVLLSPAATDGERASAFKLLQRILEEVDPGAHALIARLESPPISKEDLQRVFDRGRVQGRAEEAEKRQRAVATVTSLATNNDGGGCNGSSWREIIGFCLLNKARIRNTWEVNFIESVAGQLANPYSSLTAKQTPIVRRIFQTWFRGELA